MALRQESSVARNVADARVEMRFVPQRGDRHSLVFPCSADGHVEIDRLSERERIDYLFARALRGRDYSLAIVSSFDASAQPAHC